MRQSGWTVHIETDDKKKEWGKNKERFNLLNETLPLENAYKSDETTAQKFGCEKHVNKIPKKSPEKTSSSKNKPEEEKEKG